MNAVRFCFAALCAAPMLLTVPSLVRAQTVAITDVANTLNPEFRLIGTPGSINDAGVVAFRADRTAGLNGIYTASSTASFNPIARSFTSGFRDFTYTPTINNAGVVAFQGNLSAGGSGIYTAVNNTAFNAVALSSSTEFDQFDDSPFINSAGTVVFKAFRDAAVGGGTGIFTATGSAAFNTIARSDTSLEFRAVGQPTISDAGLVAFAANNRDTGPGGGAGVYTATSTAAFTTVARTGAGTFTSVGSPSISPTGLVLFSGGISSGGGIFTATNSTSFNTVALTTSPEFSGFTNPGINSLGTVAFLASRDAGGQGIYAILSGVANPVTIIRTGDALFGSTVTSVQFFNGGIAPNTNRVTFEYILATGVSGVARADISTTAAAAPEPGSIALLLVGGSMSMTGVFVRRRSLRRG